MHVSTNRIVSSASLALGACLTLTPVPAQAFQFNAGSTGADGPLNITVNTVIPLPPDGVIHATDVTVASGATLSFLSNENNTPVFLLSNGTVTIDGTIDVAGRNGNNWSGGAGGPGGFSGGTGGTVLSNFGALGQCGQGPQGGCYNTSTPFPGYPFTTGGSVLIPPVGGGGGAGGTSRFQPGGGGGGGGGAILIAADQTIGGSGAIRATGGLGQPFVSGAIHQAGALGGGGAIRLVAHQVSGTFVVDVSAVGGYGGLARIDAITDTSTSTVPERGQLMVARPAAPTLSIVSVGGEAITPGTLNVVVKPSGSPLQQSVVVQLQGAPPVASFPVYLTAAGGSNINQTTLYVDTNTPGPWTVTFNPTFVANTSTRLYAWSPAN